MPTIPLCDVTHGRLLEPLDTAASIRSLVDRPVEALGCAARRLVTCDTAHAFARAAHDAFYLHYPLVIRPDDVWFCIAQGFAAHVNENAEALRPRFVRHEGKLTLTVARPDFILGRDNPWPEVFEAFSGQIGGHLGALKDLISARFSTTTPMDAAAFDVCLMDAFQGYFDYEMLAGCGIPEITLLGTADDWASMIPRVRQYAEYGLETWSAALVPVLEQIAASAAGDANVDFWRSFFRYESGSGPAELTGWIVTLFPYLVAEAETKTLRPNEYLGTWQERFRTAESRKGRMDWNDLQGPAIERIPEGLVSAPVRCEDLITGETHDLRFIAGMFGVDQDPETRALTTAFGWAIVYDGPGERSHLTWRERMPGEKVTVDPR
jgi:hypothetical protein